MAGRPGFVLGINFQLVDPPLGYRSISLKCVYKVKRDELGAIVKHKARLVT